MTQTETLGKQLDYNDTVDTFKASDAEVEAGVEDTKWITSKQYQTLKESEVIVVSGSGTYSHTLGRTPVEIIGFGGTSQGVWKTGGAQNVAIFNSATTNSAVHLGISGSGNFSNTWLNTIGTVTSTDIQYTKNVNSDNADTILIIR